MEILQNETNRRTTARKFDVTSRQAVHKGLLVRPAICQQVPQGQFVIEHRSSMKGIAMKGTQKSKKSKGFTDVEREAMKDRVREMRASKADGESDLLAKIAAMQEPDRAMAKRLHAIIKASAPELSPKTWYGMPAYAKNGKVVCFFQSAKKFKTRYATFGFSDQAKLDEGHMWPTGFALKELTAAEEARIDALVKKAVS
jgi:uncharacterized protein YdhG (YjbR/CyaY superfamily)